MNEPVVIFTTSSNIEASVVMALLDSHGIQSFRSSGLSHTVWPMAEGGMGQIRVGGPELARD